ncbi:MAG: lipocalin family protein [Caulobacterales bacterium]
MKRFIILVPLLLAACVLPPVNRNDATPLGPVAAIEIESYQGRWFEIARFPNNFERDCEGVTAEYRPRADGKIDVINTCREGAPDGQARRAEAVARIVDPTTNAKLKVRFGGPFEGDYWVLDRAEDYSWALVGEPRGRFLWVLSRTPAISDPLKADLLQRLQARGYNTDALYWTAQPPA